MDSNKIKKFGEFIHTEINEAEIAEDIAVDEGWKEILIAGALSLATLKGKGERIERDTTSARPNTELSVKADSDKNQEKIVVDFGTEFLSGRYKIGEKNAAQTEMKLKQIADFVKAHQDADISITITAGESQVPNRDFEAGRQSDGEYKRMPVGALAANRASVMKDIVGNFMRGLEKAGVMSKPFEIVVDKPIVGTTTYKQGEDPGQDKFTREQFVRVTVEAKGHKKSNTADYSMYAKEGEMIYVPYGKMSNRAIGEIRHVSRETRNVKDAGHKDGAYQDMLLQTIDNMGKLTGKTYLIPWKWWNENVDGRYLNQAQWDYVQQHFEAK